MSALDSFSLKDQVIIVTGAGKGIGRGLALDIAAAGGTVIGCSRTREDLDSLEKEVADLGVGECKTLTVDITKVAGLESVYDFAEGACGRIDGVVNNAGVNVLRDAVDYTEEEVDKLFELNLKSVYWSCVIAARRMMKSGTQGAILNITSQAAVVGAPGRAPYSAAKAGVNHLTRTLAAEWAAQGIRVNALAPTVTAMPLGLRAMEQRPELAAEVAQRVALRGRAALVEEITRPALFLLSPAASLITGQTLVVDGGWTL